MAVVSQRTFFHLVICVSFGCALLSGREGFCQQAPTSHLAAPIELRCADRIEPVTVPEGMHDLSWKVKAVADSLHGVKQSSYQVRIARRGWGPHERAIGAVGWRKTG